MSALLNPSVSPGAALRRSVQYASLYVSATLAAVYLWHRLRRPSSGLLRDRPYHQYLFAAGIAVGICLLLSLAFRLAENRGDFPLTFEQMSLRLPYQLLTAAIAFGIAFLLDNPLPQEPSAKRRRLLEGAALGLLLGLLAVLVHSWLNANQPGLSQSLTRLAATGSAAGFLLGWCMPTWCRANRQAAANDRCNVVERVAAGAPQQLAS